MHQDDCTKIIKQLLEHLEPRERAFFARMIRVIYAHSANRNAAKALVDRILEREITGGEREAAGARERRVARLPGRGPPARARGRGTPFVAGRGRLRARGDGFRKMPLRAGGRRLGHGLLQGVPRRRRAVPRQRPGLFRYRLSRADGRPYHSF